MGATPMPRTVAARLGVALATGAVAPGACAAEALGAAHALQVVAGLALVLALIAASAWGARRLQVFRPQGRGRIRVLESLPLGTRERLLLVAVDEQRVLLGVSPGRIATLHAFAPGPASGDFEQALALAARAPGGAAA
jgi:flagellar protein FliO/FliZ